MCVISSLANHISLKSFFSRIRAAIFTLTENNFTGVMPTEVCDNGLETLIADCVKVDCPCCTDCFEEDDDA